MSTAQPSNDRSYLFILSLQAWGNPTPGARSKGHRVMSSVPKGPWAKHPCGGKAFQQLIQYYYERRDVQTVSGLACVASHMYRGALETAREGGGGGGDGGGPAIHPTAVSKPDRETTYTVMPKPDRAAGSQRRPMLEPKVMLQIGFSQCAYSEILYR